MKRWCNEARPTQADNRMGAPAEPTVFESALSCATRTAVNKDEYGGRVLATEATLAARHGAEQTDG